MGTDNLNEMDKFERRAYYSKGKYNVMPKPVNKDNQETYNDGSGNLGGLQSSVRVPSLKRSKKVWERFYNLFPWLKGKKTCNGGKLKKI
jgi:hypothetical protein